MLAPEARFDEIDLEGYGRAGVRGLANEENVTDSVHQLKVTLRGLKPPVWRRIAVRSDLSLGELARILEGAMGWLGGHLHAFDVDGDWYGSPDPDWPSDDLDENEYRLGDVLTAVGDRMRWDYDFGDGWEHNVVVEKIFDAERERGVIPVDPRMGLAP